MPTPFPYHLVYVPGDSINGGPDRVLTVIRTDDAALPRILADAVSDAVVLQLDARDDTEAVEELRDLGFVV